SKQKNNILEEQNRLKYGAFHVINICTPVCITMVLIVLVLKTVPSYSSTSMNLLYTPFSENVSSTMRRTTNSLLNASIFISIIIFTTSALLLLYSFNCYRFIICWLTFTTFMVLTFFTVTFASETFLSLNFPIDSLTVSMCIWNFGIMGMIAIYWKAALKIQQIYLIYISVLMALTFVKHLPEWTGWFVLIVLVVWDILAVLAPNGPLRLFVETAKQRNDSVPPALIYASFVDTIAEDLQESFQSDKNRKGIKLGLGDFIFYGVFVDL
ncbi:presenilin-2-like isoform X2, partial [Dinothrombium tinctorium]